MANTIHRCGSSLATSQLAVTALLLALWVLPGAAQDTGQPDITQALLLLPLATSDWDAVTKALPGADWAAGTNPCGSGGAGSSDVWKGVTCGGGGAAADTVTQLRLPRLGLQGTLPGDLANVSTLALLDLSNNAFQGTFPDAWVGVGGFPGLATLLLGGNRLTGALPSGLPPAASTIDLGGNRFNGSLPATWASISLEALHLDGNQLTGTLPASYASATTLPRLALLNLQGNNLSGTVPASWLSFGAFATPFTLEVRPGNARLCGPVGPLGPELFPKDHPERVSPIIPAANSLRTGDNMTTLMLTQHGLFLPSSTVTLTNWLGSCGVPCNGTPAWAKQANATGLKWPPTVATNIYDVSWTYNMSISDLVLLNPGAASLRPGAPLTVPCYPGGRATEFAYYGGSIAFGQFSGGNQQAGQDGMLASDSLPGAMAAGRVNGGLPNQFHWPSVYTGSVAPPANGSSSNGFLSEPVYWFVDMLAPFQVVSVMVTAGIDMRNASIYIGSNSSSVISNTLVASGLSLAAGQQKAFEGGGVSGRYVIIYTGTEEQGVLGLDDVQVYAFETNAAANKPVTAVGVRAVGGNSSALQAAADNNASSCIVLQSAARSGAAHTGMLRIDLGYTGTVGAVAVQAGRNISGQHSVRFYVAGGVDDYLEECNAEPLALAPGQWTVRACNTEGRYVVFELPGLAQPGSFLELCELHAALTMQPSRSGSNAASAGVGSSGAAAAGGSSADIHGGGNNGSFSGSSSNQSVLPT